MRSVASSKLCWNSRILLGATSNARARETRCKLERLRSICSRIACTSRPTQGSDGSRQVAARAGDHFGRRGGRGRSHIGYKIGDGEVDLVADGRNHRNRRLEDRPGHHLLIERPEILHGAAAASHDDHVNVVTIIEVAHPSDNFFHRARPLAHGHG